MMATTYHLPDTLWEASGIFTIQSSHSHQGYGLFLLLWRLGKQGSEVTLKAANLQRGQLWTLPAPKMTSSVTSRKRDIEERTPDMKAISYSTEIEICKNFRNGEVENYFNFVQRNFCALLQQRWEDDESSTHLKFPQNGVSWLFPVWHEDRMAFEQRENLLVQYLPKNINFWGVLHIRNLKNSIYRPHQITKHIVSKELFVILTTTSYTSLEQQS